jgi:cephalosporin-C deacetylase
MKRVFTQREIFVRLALTFFFVLVVSSLSAQEALLDSINYQFDRESQVYSVNEDAAISISAFDNNGALVNEGVLTVVLTNDGRDQLGEPKTFDLAKENPVAIKVTLNFPGFLQINATAKSVDGKQTCSKLAAAGFDPEKIEPGLPKPEDFDEFWSNSKAEVRAIPIDLQQTKIDSLSNDKRDVYSVSFATVNDQRVYGYLCVPKGGESPYPTIVNVPGAGPGVGPDTSLADKGFVSLNMNVFPYECPLDGKERQKVYDEYNEKLGMRYCYLNGMDRERYFFRPAYLGIDRAIDWLAEQDYVDATRMGFWGSSQGGASALILGGMNKHFCAIFSSVPALCDHAGMLKGRSPGWPRIVDFYNNDEEALEASRYMDGVNFARNIDEATIDITVGFIDVTCSPSSVYAAFNVIPSEKKTMYHETQLGHANGEEFNKARQRLLERVKNNGR